MIKSIVEEMANSHFLAHIPIRCTNKCQIWLTPEINEKMQS